MIESGGINTLVGSPPAMETGAAPEAAPSPRRGFGDFIPSRQNVVTDGSEWVVAVLVLGALALLILLRAGGFQTIIAAVR